MQLTVAQFKQQVASALLLLFVNHIGYAQGCRTRALAIGEDVQLGNVERLEKLVALVETFGGLATTTHHYINANEGVRHHFLISCILWANNALS